MCRYFLGNKCDKNRKQEKQKRWKIGKIENKKSKEINDENMSQKCYICPQRWKIEISVQIFPWK